MHDTHITTAKTFASKVKDAAASLASAFRAPVFAPALV